MNKSLEIYNVAAKYLGTKELPGRATNQKIKAWIKLAADWLDQDDSSTPWCGCFRGGIGIETATGVPKDHFRARSWLSWGSAVPTVRDAIKGDTVVLVRTGGFHVALFDRAVPGGVYLLGGNQGDSVSIAKFPLAQIEGIRRG